MSRYLGHLAALALNRVEPVQPRLASRFETPVDMEPSGNSGLDKVQESRIMPSAHMQLSTITGTESPVPQKNATASVDGQVNNESGGQYPPKDVEPTKFIINRSGSPADKHKPASGQGFASFDTKLDTEQASPADQSVNKPVKTESIHTLVERVQERVTETTHSELVIREVAAYDTDQKISGLEESSRPAPVKPVSIVVRSEQPIVGSNTASQAGGQQMSFARSGIEATSAPTIQVTIGRIEIRATSDTVKPASKPRTAAATMSLDEYLNRRNGGKS